MSKAAAGSPQLLNSRNSGLCDIRASDSSLEKGDNSLLSLANKNIDNKIPVTNRRYRNGQFRCRIKHMIILKIRKYVNLSDLSQEPKLRTHNLARSRSYLIRIKYQHKF